MFYKKVDLFSNSLFRQYTAAFIACLSGGCSCMAFIWMEPLLERLMGQDSPVPMTVNQISWAVSIIEIGSLITPLPAGLLADRIGRKPVLLLTSPLFIISWVLLLCLHTVPAVYTARTIQGVALGMVSTALPMYLGEIAAPNVRGSISTFFQCSRFLAFLLIFAVGPFVTYDQIVWFSLGFPVAFLLLFFWMPESPFYLMMKNDKEGASKAISWLLGTDDEKIIADELDSLHKQIEEERMGGGSWRDLLHTRPGRRALIIISVVVITSLMSGAVPIISYASTTFATVTCTRRAPDGTCETEDILSHIFTLVLCLVGFVVAIVTSFFLDSLGRRPTLLISYIGATIMLLGTTIYFFLYEVFPTLTSSVRPYYPIAVTTVILYNAFITFGPTTITYTYQAELFSTSTRGVASAITTLVVTVVNFISLKLYPIIQEDWGVYANFFIFTLFSLFGALYIWKKTPETKGKTFEEIQKSL